MGHLQHDCVSALATYLAQVVAPHQTEEQQCEFLGHAYEAVKAMLEGHEIMKNRELARLKPCSN